MDLSNITIVPTRMHECPIFGKEIANGLCWEISNIGDDTLPLPPDEIPPCGWDEAHKICDKCPWYC